MNAWISAFAAATVAAPFLLFAANLLGLPLGRPTVYTCILLAAALVRMRAAGGKGALFPSRPPFDARSWSRKACVLLLVLVVTTALVQAVSLPLYHWDALVLYGFKAKVLFQAGTFRTPAFLDPGIVHPNTNYPLLVPYLEAAFYAVLGRVDERLVRILFFVYWLAYLALVYRGLRLKTGRDASLALTALLGTVPLFFIDDATQAVSGSVDVPFAFYWTGAVLSAIEYREEGAPRSLDECLIFSFGCLFTKPHGLALVAIPAAIAFRGRVDRTRWRSVAVFLASAACWLWTRSRLPDNVDYAPRVFEARMLATAWHRIPIVGEAWLRELARFDHWGLFWAFILAALGFAAYRRRLPSPVRLILAALGVQALVYIGVSLVVPNEIGSFLDATLPRLAIHLSGLAVIAAGWALEGTKPRRPPGDELL